MIISRLFNLAMLVSASTLFLATSATAQQFGGDRAANVVVAEIAFAARTERVETIGNAEALNSVSIFPAVGDLVTAVNFVAGQQVAANSVLVELDSRRQQTALRRAEIELADANRTLERLRASRERGAIPQSDLDDAITMRDLREVAVEEAKTNLADRYIRAPFAGVVGITDVEVGDRITEQTLITTLDDRGTLYIDFQAPESALALLQQTETIAAQPWQDSSQSLELTLQDIDTRVNANDRSIRVRALLDNSADNFRPGMSFRVQLELRGATYAVIPEAALMWGAEGAYVWRVTDSRAERVDVEIRQRLRGSLLVSGGFSAGDLIVMEGVQTLRPNQRLVILNADNVTQIDAGAEQ